MLASLSKGGHLRVGMEDVLTISRGVPVESNAQLVERAVADRGAGPAHPDDTRRGARADRRRRLTSPPQSQRAIPMEASRSSVNP